MKQKILINCSNLHAGGGINVALSFIGHLSERLASYPDLLFDLYLSKRVDSSLRDQGINLCDFNRVLVFDLHPSSLFNLHLQRLFCGYRSVFTVFGPVYFLFRIPNHIVGFARPQILYPSSQYLPSSFNVLKIFAHDVSKLLLALFFVNSSFLVFETSYSSLRLKNILFLRHKKTFVVPNSVSQFYFDISQDIVEPDAFYHVREGFGRPLKLGIISRNYIHKNLAILPKVKSHLESFGISVSIYVTFTDSEWSSMSHTFRSSIVNVGPLLSSACPEFYKTLDGLIFPSLLECFSVSPLEAISCNLPVFCSNLPFMFDIYGDCVVYFDPYSAYNIASVIHSFYLLPGSKRLEFLTKAKSLLASFPSSRDRFTSYMSIIQDSLK